MKILLTTLNSKYVHSNLALKYLYEQVYPLNLNITLQEFTINNEYDYIFGEIVSQDYDVIVVSCYIWNVEKTRELFENIRKACPKVKIILGGPEVSYESKKFLEENLWVDVIIRGEGEVPFYQIAKGIKENNLILEKIPSLTFREGGNIKETQDCSLLNMKDVPFPYEHLPIESDKVIYYESSRGCPYRCSYCISSLDKTIRARSVEDTKKQLKVFINKNVKQVKFIDRTFNFSKDRAFELWKFLIENDNGYTNFHFEICAELVEDRHITLLEKARKDLFQFEIGIQTTREETLEAINRHNNLEKIFRTVEKLIGLNNCHVHVDLIAGLPLEDFASFKNSFNQVYKLKAHCLQLGFLKLLKGTKIYGERQEHGYKYRSQAPYEVISNKYISPTELVQLKRVEKVLDLYYNKDGHRNYLDYILTTTKVAPFDFYYNLGNYYHLMGFQHRSHKKEDLYRILYSFTRWEGNNLGLSNEDLCEAFVKLEEDLVGRMNFDAVKKFNKKGWELTNGKSADTR